MRIDDYASPEELRRLLSAFLTVTAGLSLAALFAVIVVPALRVSTFPIATGMFATNRTGWLDPTEYPPARGYTVPGVDIRSVLEPRPELLGLGRTLFVKNCAPCHGAAGDGRGPATPSLTPPPRDFTRPQGWLHGYGLVEIFETLTRGVPATPMGAFDFLPPRDRLVLARYVQSLGRFPHPREPEKVAALARELRAQRRVPARIPVRTAMEKLAAESRLPVTLPVSGPQARLIADPRRAAVWLSRTRGWRAGPGDLARLASAQAPSNGFRVSTTELGSAGWADLYEGLITALR